MKSWHWVAISATLLIGPSHAAVVDVLVPAYANPCCGAGRTMWPDLNAAASNPYFTLNVIFNPASGPGSSVDPNYLRTGPGGTKIGALVDLHAAGAVISGYVATTYGAKDITAVKSEIDKYFSSTFYGGYVDTIFFDEMSNDLTKVGYYQQLHDYVKGKNGNARVIGNPGTPYTFASGQTSYTVADYAASMDVLVTFENTGQQYLDNYTPPSWVGSQPAEHFAHLVHSQSTWNDNLVALAASRNAGMLYITNDDLSAWNPWDQLPTYWDAEIAAISAHNIAAVPEPSSLTLLGLGFFGILGWRMVVRRRASAGLVTPT